MGKTYTGRGDTPTRPVIFAPTDRGVVMGTPDASVVIMQDVTTRTHTVVVDHVAEPAKPSWHTEVGDLLAQAALACIEHGVDADAFMRGAWSAYVEARPGFKEYLEDLQLKNQLEELRKAGQMGKA